MAKKAKCKYGRRVKGLCPRKPTAKRTKKTTGKRSAPKRKKVRSLTPHEERAAMCRLARHHAQPNYDGTPAGPVFHEMVREFCGSDK